MRIVVFGPGPIFKGGIANFSASLARSLDASDEVEVHMVSWTQQYPFFIPRDFVDRKSKSDFLENSSVRVHYVTNWNNPLSWYRTAELVAGLNPDMVIIQWYAPVQGIPIGFIVRRLISKTTAKVVFDMHYAHRYYHTTLYKYLTRFGVGKGTAYVVHSYKTACDVKELFPKLEFSLVEEPGHKPEGHGKPILKLFHPVYDMFVPDIQFDVAAQKEKWHLQQNVFLFFGFIYKYKGLHHALRAFAELCKTRSDVSLLIAGESAWQGENKKRRRNPISTWLMGGIKSWILGRTDEEAEYNPLALIAELGISDKVLLVNEFIPSEEVHRYFQVSDAIVLFYEQPNSSGVESIAYNFRLPILATRMGHFTETVKDGFNGYLCSLDDPQSLVQVMEKSIVHPIARENVERASNSLSWNVYVRSLLDSMGILP